jgi:hypothetical protein
MSNSSIPPATEADMENNGVVKHLAVLDPIANAKNGQKTAMIIRDGKPAVWTMSGEVQPLWQPSAFKSLTGDSAGRLSLCVSGDREVLHEAEAIDMWAVAYATEHSERFFGKKLNFEQVKDRYNGILKKSDAYQPFIKIKLGTDKNAPNFWDTHKSQRSPPEDFTKCHMTCNVRLSSFWFMSTSWGLTAQLTDALINAESQVVCPF